MIELQSGIRNLDFTKSEHFCQPMELVCSSIDLTDSNVIPAPLSVRRLKFRRTYVDVQRICNGLPKLQNSIYNVRTCLRLSLRT